MIRKGPENVENRHYAYLDCLEENCWHNTFRRCRVSSLEELVREDSSLTIRRDVDKKKRTYVAVDEL